MGFGTMDFGGGSNMNAPLGSVSAPLATKREGEAAPDLAPVEEKAAKPNTGRVEGAALKVPSAALNDDAATMTAIRDAVDIDPVTKLPKATPLMGLVSSADAQMAAEVAQFARGTYGADARRIDADFLADMAKAEFAADKEKLMERCDKYVTDRISEVHDHGNILNDMHPFTDANAYAQTLISYVRGGWNEIATDEFRAVQKAVAEKDRAGLVRMFGIIETKDEVDESAPATIPGAQSITGYVPQYNLRTVRKTDKEIDAEINDCVTKAMARNFMFLYNAMKPELSDEGAEIVDHVITNGKFDPADADALRRLYAKDRDEGDRVYFLAQSARPTAPALGTDTWYETKKMMLDMGEKSSTAMDALWRRFVGGYESYRLSLRDKERYERMIAQGVSEEYAKRCIDRDVAARKAYDLADEKDRLEMRHAELALDALQYHKSYEGYNWWQRSAKGIAVTLPYMAINAAPYGIGFVINCFYHMQDIEDQINLDGGDPTNGRALRALLAVAWAGVEKLEFNGMFGRTLTRMEKRLLWKHLSDAGIRKMVPAGWNIMKAYGKETLVKTGYETFQEGVQGALEAAEYDIGFFNHLDPKKRKDAHDVLVDATGRFFTDMKESVGTMAGMALGGSALGTVRNVNRQYRAGLDRESIDEMIRRNNAVDAMVDGTWVNPDVSGTKPEHRRKVLDRLVALWTEAKDRDSAMETIRAEFGFTEDQAGQVADWLDLRQATLDGIAREYGTEELGEAIARLAEVSHRFRIGNDTAYDVADFYSLLNPNIRVEDVEIEDTTKKPVAVADSERLAGLRAEKAEAERNVRDAKVGSARRGAQRELRRINRKIAAEEARKPEPKRPTKTLRRVTIPMVNPDGTATEKHIVISEESNGMPKDIKSEGFAVSVAAAMRKAGIPLGGIDMKDDESERKAAAWFQNLAENNEADAMQIVLANGLFDKGRFEVVDEETGKTLADADGIITLARKVANESLKAGNLTLGHEHTHAVIKFARQIGVFGDETDPNYDPAKNDTVVAMRKLFGDPKKSDELFDEEYFGDALAAFLRDEYDFAKHTSADNRLLTERILDGVGNLAKYAANRILGGFGVNLVTQREVNLRREGQIAAFQAIRQGDFRGLSKYVGIRFTGGAKPKAAPATVKTPAKAAWRLRKGGAVNVPTKPTDASTGAPDAVSGDSAETARLKAENERLLHELNVALAGGKVTVPARVGGVHEVKSPISNLSMKVQWEWIPRKDVVPAKSGSSIQERFRTLDEASKDRLRRRASKGKFMPDRFTFNTIGDRGAPIVAGGNICLSGNGRMILLSLVAERGGYSEYLDYVRQWCRENGIPDCPADMLDKEPVLVQRIVEAPSQEAVEQFARECNRDDKEPLGSAATAKAGVRAITPALMRLYDVPASGDFMSKSNWPFIEKFYEALGENVPKDELTKSILPEAGLRVQRAFLAKILGGDASEDEEYQKAVFVLIGNLLSGGNSTATVRDALTRNGAELFAMLGNRGSYNVIPELRAAVETYVGWRAAVQRNPTLSLKDYVDTPDFFRVTSPIQDALTQLIETRYFNAVLKKYNELVAKQSVDAQAMLDIAGAERLTSGQILAMAEREVVEKDADGNPVTPYVTKDPSWGGYALQPQSAPAVSAPVAANPEPKPSKDEERKLAQAEREKAMEEHLAQMSPDERAEYDAIMAKAETMPTVSEMMAAAEEILRKREDDKPFVPCPAAKGTAAVPNALAPGRGELRLVETAQNGNTTERTWNLGAGVWDYLRIPYFTSKLTKPSKQDEAGRGLWSGKPLPAEAQGLLAKYQGKCPRYMGNKNAMTDRTVRTLWEKMSKAERAHYTAVVDCFGGGGCWGLTIAITCFPNANRLIVNEFDEGRLEKIRLLQTRDGSFEAEVRQFFTEKVFGEEFDAAVQMARGLIDFRVKFLAYANSLTLTPDERGMIQAVYDNMMSRLQFGEMDELGNFSSALQFEASFKKVGEDAVEATELAQAYAARGGSITYVCGDAKNQATFGAKVGADGRVSRTNTEGEDFAVPSGDSVVKVCDPPYYRTTGYNDDGSMSEVGFDENPYGWGYKDTEKMLSGIVDSGSAIVYTDEAWFYGKDFKEQKNDADYGQAGLFAFEESLWKREQDVLCGIINNLDHFDVAGDVASRFETLGVHHGHRNERSEGNADAGGNGVGQESQAADGAVHGRGGVDGVHQGVDGMAAGASAEDGAVHGRGDSSRGRGGVEESADRAVAKEACVQAIEEAVEKAGETVTPDMDTAIRHSVRLVREERMADYARLVSSNAPRWLRARRRALDRRMDEAGYTERVWHGTEGDDFNVFRFGTGSHGVRASYFTYRRGTAENYAAIRSMDAVDLDNAKPNVRQYYVNPGRVLDLDEGKPGHATTYQEFVALVKKAYADGYDSVRVMNAYDDQGFRFNGDETMENMVVPDEAHDVKTDILIVFDRDGNPGANRVKAADAVTFADDGLPIPTSMRADIGSSDVRYSVRLKNHWSVLRGPFDTPQGVVVTSSGCYSAHNRELAWGLKLGRQKAIDEAARIMAPSIPDNAVIVPMPNHEGRAVRTMLLAYAISGEKDGVDIVDALEADPHETSHHSKKIGIAPKITMRRRDVEIPPNRPVVIVDNVYASGATFAAAKAVLPEATLNVLADAGRVQVKRETPAERHSVFIGIRGADKAKIAQGRLGRALEILDEYELRHYEEGEDFDPSNNDTFRRDTYVQTGWWMGTDGMWRYEIGNVKPKTRFGKTVGDGSMMKNGIMFADRNDHSHGYCDIESICRNNALFHAYPELKDICVKISDPDTMGDYIGQYDPGRNTIEISWDLVQWHDDEVSNVLTAEGVRVITHELQHAVQEIEDFSRGGNVEAHGATNYRRLAGEVEARNVEHRDWGVYYELSGVNADEKLREEFADSFAPWFTEDVPQANQILIGSDGAMRDQHGNPVARHSVEVQRVERESAAYADLLNGTRYSLGTKYADRNAYDEEEVRRLAATGDIDAIAEYFVRNEHMLIGIVKQFGKSLADTDADDILSAVREGVIRKYVYEGGVPGVPFGAVVVQRVRFTALKTIKGQAGSVRSREILSLDSQLDSSDSDSGTFVDMTPVQDRTWSGEEIHNHAREEAHCRVEEFLSHYSGEKADIFRERTLEGMSYTKISRQRGIPGDVLESIVDGMIAEWTSGEYKNRTPASDSGSSEIVSGERPEIGRKTTEFNTQYAVQKADAKTERKIANCTDYQKAVARMRLKGMSIREISDKTETKYTSVAHALYEVTRKTGVRFRDRRANSTGETIPARVRQVFDYFEQNPDATQREAAAALGMRQEKVSLAVRDGIRLGLGDNRIRQNRMQERMKEVVRLADEGVPKDEIAAKLGITIATVNRLGDRAHADLGWTGEISTRRTEFGTRNSVRVVEREVTEDDVRRVFDPNYRNRVVATRSMRRPIDVVTGYAAAQLLGGRDVKVEDLDATLKNVGIAGASAPDVLAAAQALADRKRESVKTKVGKADPNLYIELANDNLRQRVGKQIDDAVINGAAIADPEIGVRVERAAQAQARRALDAAKGFTARQMQQELPISLADAVFAEAEYERSPEEQAKLEEQRKKREEEREAEKQAAAEAGMSVEEYREMLQADRDANTVYVEPDPQQKKYFDELMDRAKAAKEKEAAKDAERKAKAKAKAEAEGKEDGEEGADDEGGADGDGEDILPIETVKRIAPIFGDADTFAMFIAEWCADNIVKRHPEIPNTAQMWRNPVAVRELIKTAQGILEDLAMDVLGSPEINSARNYADRSIILLAERKTYKGVVKHIAYTYDMIHNQALRLSRRKLVGDLVKAGDKATGAKGRFSATQEMKTRTTFAKTELWWRHLRPFLTMGEEKLAAEIARLQGIVDGYNKESAEDGYDADNFQEYRDACDCLALANRYGGMVRWMPSKIQAAAAEIMQDLNGRRAEFEAMRDERDEDNKRIREAIIRAVVAGGTERYRKDANRLIRTISGIADDYRGQLLLELQNLVRFCKDENARAEALDAFRELDYIISSGSEKYRVTYGQGLKEVHDALADIYGSAIAGARHLKEKIPEDVALQIFSQQRNYIPTYGQLIQLYASCLQKDYKDNVEKHDRADQIELMRDALTTQDLALHAWAIEWYAHNRQALSDAVEEITGLSVASPDNLYCPVRVLQEKSGFAVEALAWCPVPSALNRRVKHGLDFNEGADFLNMLEEQCEIRAQLIGYGMAGIRLRDTIAHHDVQSAVAKHVGRGDMKIVTDHVRDVLVQNVRSKNGEKWLKPLNVARKWASFCYLAYNLVSASKQLVSMAMWAVVKSNRDALHYFATAFTREGRDRIRELIDTDGYRARYVMGWSEETLNMMINPTKNKWVKYIENFYSFGMKPMMAADKLGSLWMAQGFYGDMKQQQLDLGFNEEEAKERAATLTWAEVERTQQSGRTENFNRIQRSQGGLNAFFQFMSSQMLQNAYEIQAWKEVAAGTPGAKGRLARAIFVNHVVIPALLEAIAMFWRGIMGEDMLPDEPEDWPPFLKELAFQMVFSQTAPLFFVSSIVRTTWNKLTGTKSRFGYSSSAPAVEFSVRVAENVGTLVFDAGKFGAQEFTPLDFEEEVTVEKLQDEFLRAADSVLAPARHLHRAVKNRTE